MRIPDSQYFAMSQASIGGKRTQLSELFTQASTGRRVNKPSDDPVAAARARRAVGQETRARDHERAADIATTSLQLADSTLNEVGSALHRARQLAVQGANDSLSAEDRVAIANEVAELRSHLLGLANAKQGDRHLFSGLADDTAAFDPAGTYQGNATEQLVEISPGVRVAMGISGDEIFGAAGGQNVFTAMDALDGALRADDVAAVRTALEQVQASDNQVSGARGKLGAYMTAVEIGRSVAQRSQVDAHEAWQQEVAADQFEVFSEITRAQQALQAAVQMAAQLPPPGLLGQA